MAAVTQLKVAVAYLGLLLFHYYLFVCNLRGKAVAEKTYTVSGGTLNPYSLTHSLFRLPVDRR